MKCWIFAIFASVVLCFGATFSPNPDAGMVSVSVDQTSLQGLLTTYDNAGYYDFQTTEKLEAVDEIKLINKYYFHDFQINLDNDDIKFNMEGVLDANARKKILGIPFHPHVKTSGITASAAAIFKDFGLSTSDNNVHLNVCLSDVSSDISDISYGYGSIIDNFVIDGLLDIESHINDRAQATIDATTATLADASKCIDLTNQIGISYPKFLEPVAIQSARTKIRNNSVIAYGCPVAKSMIGDVVVVNDGPCGTVAYNFSIYTADDINNAGTNSNITATLCGDDVSGSRKCFDTKLSNLTGKGQISHVLVENSSVLIDNLSLTLTSDNSGKKPEWFVDSVAVDMNLPNNSTFHRWFPVNSWIGGDAPKTYTVNQGEGLQVYTFTVSTGSESMFYHAGTNSYILADVCDVNSKCLTFNLDKDGYNDFEAGSTTTYTIVTSEKLADVISMTLHNVYDGEHPGWYVQDVVYSHYSFPENKDHSIKDGQGFMFRQWLADGKNKGAYYTSNRLNRPTKTTSEFYLNPVNASPILYIRDISATRYVNDNFGYNVTIKTKGGGASGTDADIVLTLEGCSGEIETFNLNDDRNNFEKGNTDVFNLSGIKDLNGIKKITLASDGGGDGAGWTPEYIDVNPVIYDNLTYRFYYAPIHYDFTRSLSKTDGLTWEYETGLCSALSTPVIFSTTYEAHPGDYLTMLGKNLNVNQNIAMNLDRIVPPIMVTSRFAKFQVPSDAALGEYNLGSVTIDGVVQQVYVRILGEKPILDGIAVTVAEPEDAFEVSMRNIDASSQFYLANYPLKTLQMSKKSVYVQIPKNIENGIYPFRVVSKGWDITYSATVEIINSIVPHAIAVSDSIVYTGQTLVIFGKNFGTDVKNIVVKIGDAVAPIESVENEKIEVKIPSGVSGEKVALSVARDGVPAPESITLNVKSLPWFMSFDDTNRQWTSDNANLIYDNVVKVGEVGYSLKVHGNGYMTITSPTFNTYELGAVSDKLLLDIWIPENQVNPYWYGDAQLSVNIPAAGLYNAWAGQIPLTGLKPGWNTLSFSLSQNIYTALAGDFPNATISVILNVNQNSEDYRIDNMRFGGDVQIRTTKHTVAGNLLDVYSADFMSFDNINDWKPNNADLLFVEAPKIEGLGATGVMGSGYMEIKSRNFTPSELEFVSNVISLNLYVPNPQPNDYWVGSIGMGISCPDNGIYSMHFGDRDLTHMFREEYNNVQFNLPESVISALRYGVGECYFSIYLNVNNGAGLFLLDNMGFLMALEVAKAW